MRKIKLLVFPCGSEIGLEIHRSLRYSTHIDLIGANSTDDHGRYVYKHYIGDLPFANDPHFISAIKQVVIDNGIDAIYPAMDSVITILSENASELGCKIIASPVRTTQICLSKTLTYKALEGVVPLAEIYGLPEEIKNFPVFIKPDIGYGSRGAKVISSLEDARLHLNHFPESVILELLPGPEYTVDCFSDKNGSLRFCGPRVRGRIMNGISVNTFPVKERVEEFNFLANSINKHMRLRGAWFFQVKERDNGELVLLEVASRLGGSSSMFRNLGVNFAMLSVFDAFDMEVSIVSNKYEIVLDRALANRYKIDMKFDTAYIDFDDCVLLGESINVDMIKLIYQFINQKKRIILITKHDRNIHETLSRHKLSNVFDEVIHLEKHEEKYRHMAPDNAIFIDDSYAERAAVHTQLNIPVFAPDAIESLLD